MTEAEYEVLNILEFNSTRKRMSVVLRAPDNRILLYCKASEGLGVGWAGRGTVGVDSTGVMHQPVAHSNQEHDWDASSRDRKPSNGLMHHSCATAKHPTKASNPNGSWL